MAPEAQLDQEQDRPHLQRDLELVRAALLREPQAQHELLTRLACVRRILAHKNTRHGRPLGSAELDDLVQDTLLAVWRKLGQYAGQGVLEAWVYRFCIFEFMVRLRNERRRPRLLEDSAEVPEELSALGPVSAFDYDHVHLALQRLGSPEADVIRLKHFEGLTFDEIAARTQAPTNTVKTRYYRGLEFLRRVLSRYERPQRMGERE